MLFCPNGTSWDVVWGDEGINRCFFDSLTAGVLAGFILFCGILRCILYNRYSKKMGKKLLETSRSVYPQVIFSLLMMVGSVVYMILQNLTLYDKVLYGYQVLTAVAFALAYTISLCLILLEKRSALPSIPTRGYSLLLLLFWALGLVRENVAFISLRSSRWWWKLDSESDKIELGFWAMRYVCTLSLLVLRISGWGLRRRHRPVMLNSDEPESSDSSSNRSPSTWANVFSRTKMMLPYVWPKKDCFLQLTVIMCLIILILGRVLNVFVPLYSKYIVNSLTSSPEASVKEELKFRWDLIMIYVGLIFLKGGGTGTTGLLNNLRTFLWIKIQQYTTRRIQVNLFNHLHCLSLRWHLQRKTGEVLRVVSRGTNSINSLLSYVVFQIVPNVADIMIAIVYFMTAFNYLFGLIVFISMALYLSITIIVTEWRTKYRREMNKQDNESNAVAVDSILNFETVKYYGANDFETERYDKAIVLYQTAEWKSSASLNLLNTMQNVIITLGYMAGALLCAWAVVYSVAGLNLTVGDYVLFGAYLAQVFVPLNWLGNYYRFIQQAFIDMENMFDLLDEEEEVKDIPDAEKIVVHHGNIEFKDVCFGYEPVKPILKNISFNVRSGQTLALVGHIGCGKSTIIRLLFRFYDINSGVIRIDGKDISMVNQQSLRQSIGVVPQDTVLFNSDIRYNIRYGRVTATDEEIEDAARAAEIHDRILTFPKKYDSVVGERGLKLSGGEKQRVAIARTLIKAPPIVLLDEATSALDTKTERQIQRSLEQVCENRTTIIVAHRLSTIIHAHQILVLQEGEIMERGTHEELLRKGGLDLHLLKKSGKDPCGVCQKGVGSNAIFCGGCLCWIHKKCSGIKGPLCPNPDFRCARCLGTARPIDGRIIKEVAVDDEKLEAVPEFCYLGDMLSAGGGCELAAVTRCKCAWGKFRQLLPLLTNRSLPLLTRGRVYSTCVRSVMLHAAETWAMTAATMNRMRRNDRAMIRWICNVKAMDEVSSDSLLLMLGIQDLDVVLRTSRMRWFGHVERSTGWIAKVRKLNVVAQKRPGRPKKTWDEVLVDNRKKLGMDSANPQNRSEWRGRLRRRLVKQAQPSVEENGL